jgi:outer membrane phospholipase A
MTFTNWIMSTMTRVIAMTVIVLTTTTIVHADEKLNYDKGETENAEFTDKYPQGILDLVRKGDSFLTSYRPMYLGYSLYSNKDSTDKEIKFQISFKYNLVDNIFLGYTQKSMWVINKPSAPMKETDYSPELFYIHDNDANVFGENTWLPYEYMLFGLRHESNGVRGQDSHGWNMVFIEPYFSFPNYHKLIISPSVWYPFTSEKNKVLVDDIGVGKLTLRWQPVNWFQFSSELRHGLKGNTYGVENKLDLFIDKRNKFSPNLFIQTWNGFGETLASHAINSSRILVGFSVTRSYKQ